MKALQQLWLPILTLAFIHILHINIFENNKRFFCSAKILFLTGLIFRRSRFKLPKMVRLRDCNSLISVDVSKISWNTYLQSQLQFSKFFSTKHSNMCNSEAKIKSLGSVYLKNTMIVVEQTPML
jgi:hypothetical protein